jgi:hypothetical protein
MLVTVAPLSLSNVVIVVLALSCCAIVLAQLRGRLFNVPLTVMSAALGVVVALLLLAEELAPTMASDALWLGGLVVGFLAGRRRGWRLRIPFGPAPDGEPRDETWDSVLAALLLPLAALLDLLFVVLKTPLFPLGYVAAVAALCGGFLAGRAFVVTARVTAMNRI